MMEKIVFSGKVIKGFQVGSKFGIATANLSVTSIPDNIKPGVYLVKVRRKTELENLQKSAKNRVELAALMHLGERKTFGSDFSIEVHILNFHQDIYEEVLEIEVCKFLREIKKFVNGDVLFTQISKDIDTAKLYFKKQELRAIIYKKWRELARKEREILFKKALIKISEDNHFLSAKNIAIYAPQESCEINFTSQLMQNFPEKNYFFPKVLNEEQGKMEFFPVKKYADLITGKFNLLEPQGDGTRKSAENLENPQIFDVMFIPALAVDETGIRLGKGGGFYDRFLEKLEQENLENYKNIQKIMILPSFALINQIPAEKHDKSIDKVILC